MYLNTYSYFKYFYYNKTVKSNEPLIIKSVRSPMHSLSTPVVHTTNTFAKDEQKVISTTSIASVEHRY